MSKGFRTIFLPALVLSLFGLNSASAVADANQNTLYRKAQSPDGCFMNTDSSSQRYDQGLGEGSGNGYSVHFICVQVKTDSSNKTMVWLPSKYQYPMWEPYRSFDNSDFQNINYIPENDKYSGCNANSHVRFLPSWTSSDTIQAWCSEDLTSGVKVNITYSDRAQPDPGPAIENGIQNIIKGW